MDINDIRGLLTATALFAFLGLWVWAWSRRRKADFEVSANRPLEDDRRPPTANTWEDT